MEYDLAVILILIGVLVGWFGRNFYDLGKLLSERINSRDCD